MSLLSVMRADVLLRPPLSYPTGNVYEEECHAYLISLSASDCVHFIITACARLLFRKLSGCTSFDCPSVCRDAAAGNMSILSRREIFRYPQSSVYDSKPGG